MTPEQRRLAETNMKLVHALVREHMPPAPWRREDLISAGYEALCDAAERWEPENTASFTTFATSRIVGAFVDEIRRLRWGKRLNGVERPATLLEPEEMMQVDSALTHCDDTTQVEVDEFVQSLPEGDRLMVILHLMGNRGAEVGHYMGVSRSRVSQKLRSVHEKLAAANG